jgi:hypothetical protein
MHQIDRTCRDAMIARLLPDRLKPLFHGFGHLPVIADDRVVHPAIDRRPYHLRGQRRRHRDDGDLGLERPRQRQPMFDTLRRQLRTVGCDQDMLVHRGLLADAPTITASSHARPDRYASPLGG